MKEYTKEERNRAIALFDGYTIKFVGDTHQFRGVFNKCEYVFCKNGKSTPDLYYYENYNDLMPVVDKMVKDGEFKFSLTVTPDGCGTSTDKPKAQIFNYVGSTLESIFLTVSCYCIQWCMDNKKQFK